MIEQIIEWYGVFSDSILDVIRYLRDFFYRLWKDFIDWNTFYCYSPPKQGDKIIKSTKLLFPIINNMTGVNPYNFISIGSNAIFSNIASNNNFCTSFPNYLDLDLYSRWARDVKDMNPPIQLIPVSKAFLASPEPGFDDFNEGNLSKLTGFFKDNFYLINRQSEDFDNPSIFVKESMHLILESFGIFMPHNFIMIPTDSEAERYGAPDHIAISVDDLDNIFKFNCLSKIKRISFVDYNITSVVKKTIISKVNFEARKQKELSFNEMIVFSFIENGSFARNYLNAKQLNINLDNIYGSSKQVSLKEALEEKFSGIFDNAPFNYKRVLSNTSLLETILHSERNKFNILNKDNFFKNNFLEEKGKTWINFSHNDLSTITSSHFWRAIDNLSLQDTRLKGLFRYESKVTRFSNLVTEHYRGNRKESSFAKNHYNDF